MQRSSLGSDAADRFIGRSISHYQVLQKIGQGGMGVVYRAHDTHLDRDVALKILPTDRVTDAERVRRFVQEARAASALNHPNIVTIHDIDTAGDVHFIAMEYVPGDTLDRLITRRGMPLRQAVDCAVQVADALGKAHAAGIIHRDIKPSNIIVTADGVAKILDFGLAKLVERPEQADDQLTRTTAPLTEEGQIVGTIAYMSPEQAAGGRLDARSDIFSFGAVLYEMVTGRRAFDAGTPASTMKAILAGEPPAPGEAAGGLPFELERAISRCLRKDPQRRWQNMADLKVALLDLRDELDSGRASQVSVVAAQPVRRIRRWLVGAMAAVLVVTAAGFAWWLFGRAAPAAPGFELERLTFEGSAVLPPAISADGNLIAYASERDGRFSLFVRQMRAREAIRLPQHESNDWFPCFSPDGLKIVYRSERDGGGLYMIDALGGTSGAELKLADGGHYPSFSPDGTAIAYIVPNALTQEGQMFLVSAGGGVPRRFQTEFVAMATETVHKPLLWSPDGEHILFDGRRTATARTRGWWIAAVAGGEAVSIKDMPRATPMIPRFAVAWRGRYLYYVEGEPINGSTLYRVPLSPGPWRVTGRPEKVASPTGLQLGGSTSSPGRMVFTAITPVTNVWSASLAPGGNALSRLERVTTDSMWKLSLTTTANGSKVAYTNYTHPAQRNVEVRIRDLATGRESMIAGSGNWPLLGPTLSLDGARVGYSDLPEQKLLGYVADASSGSGRVVCEDCTVLALFNNQAAALVQVGNRLLRQPLDGGPAVAVADLPSASGVALSPDGGRLAFVQPRPDSSGALYVADIAPPPATATASKLIAEDRNYIGSPAWSPDGKLLYYVSQRDGFPCVWRQPIAADGAPAGPAVAALHLHPGSNIFAPYNNIAVAGDRIFLLVTEVKGDVWSVTLDR